MSASAFTVFVGLFDKNNYNAWTKQIRAEKVVQHESYDSYRTRNDIAMIKLAVILHKILKFNLLKIDKAIF